MFDISAHPVVLPHHGKGPPPLYFIIFAFLFVFGLVAFLVVRMTGRKVRGGVISAAREAAYASAGYAVIL